MWLTRFLGKAGTITFSYPKGLRVGRGGGGGGVGVEEDSREVSVEG